MSYNKLIQIDGKLVKSTGKNIITEVAPGSPAEHAGILPGDQLLKINNTDVKDILDYKYLTAAEEFTLTLKREDSFTVQINKETYEDTGLSFESGIIDKASRCSNNCVFCFIDQLPPGMRETLYFKDDDSRLSFLQGNFVTLTNMTDKDIQRIIDYKISPINISVHTTDPTLRVAMLNNRNAGNILDRMRKLAENKIRMSAQIVLVLGYNDGIELDKTLSDLGGLYPYVTGVAIVPVGMTKYRDGLPKLNGFKKDSASKTIEQLKLFQESFKKEHGTNFARCSDEFYTMAGLDVPDEDFYEGFGQIEDGIGMIRLFRESVSYDVKKLRKGTGSFSFVTGTSAYNEIKNAANLISDKNPSVKTDVYRVVNDFFGTSITVAGLLTGTDIIKNLKNNISTDYLIMPRNMYRAGEEVMLDGITKSDLEKELGVKILIVDYTGEDLIKTINKELKR